MGTRSTHSTMKSVIFFLVVLAVYQVAAVPIFGLFGRPGGNAAGFGTGNASPYGASSIGLGVANSYNGGFASGSGNGYASGSPYGGYQSGGNGQAFSFGK